MNLNNFSPDFDETPLHSTEYAKVANGNSFGASTPQPFSERLQIDGNRQQVRRYRDSLIAHGHHRSAKYHRMNLQRPSTRQPPETPLTAKKTNDARSLREPSSKSPYITQESLQTKNFAEPPRRGYNPFQ